MQSLWVTLAASHSDLIHMIQPLLSGLLVTLTLFVLTLLFSLPLGLILAFARMSRFTPLQLVTKFYISVMRGTPLMLQLMVVFYGPYYLFRWSLPPRLLAAVIGFVLNYAAYFAEIYRAGIESIPVGQHEAAQMLRLSKPQAFFHVVLPQVIKRILPPVTNEIITLVKDTSLAQIIVVVEMFERAKRIAAAETTMIPFVVAAVLYYIFNLAVAAIMGRVEKRLTYYQ